MRRRFMLVVILACASHPASTTTGFTDQASGASVDLGVQDFLNRTEPRIIECYMGTLADPTHADDAVQLQFVIDGAGKVSRVLARQSSITDPRFMTCVQDLMAAQKVVNDSGKSLAVTRDYTFRPAK
jgi:hypothetical protein